MNTEADVAGTVAPRGLPEIYAFFALTFAISWGSGGLFLVFHRALEPVFGRFGPHNAIFYVAAYAPTLSALALSAIFGGTKGVRALLARLARPVRPVWVVLAALLFPALALALAAMPALGLGRRPHHPMPFSRLFRQRSSQRR